VLITTGPIIYLKVLTRRIIILNSAADAHELLERRSAIFSDRPYLYMLHDLAGRRNSVFNVPTENERHKIYRRLLATELNPRATLEHAELFQSEARLLLQRLDEMPDKFMRLIRL
jgi:cytochrome P450